MIGFAKSQSSLPTDEKTKRLASLIASQKPWQDDMANWLAAEEILKSRSWRRFVIMFSGEKERSGWEWADLLIKISVPVLIVSLSTAYSIISATRQEAVLVQQKESEAVVEYLKQMQPLLLDRKLNKGGDIARVIAVSRALTMATLSRLKSDSASSSRSIVMRYLIDSGVNNDQGFYRFFRADLSGADLSGASLKNAVFFESNMKNIILANSDLRAGDLTQSDLSGAEMYGMILEKAKLTQATLPNSSLSSSNLREADLRLANVQGSLLVNADLRGAKLNHANLSDAKLVGAILINADLRNANLKNADLSGANLQGALLTGSRLDGIKSNRNTIWPRTFAGLPH